MTDNATWLEKVRLPIIKMQDVLLARFVVRDQGTQIGLTASRVTSLATAVSEITRNVVKHAGCHGVLQIGEIADGNRLGLRVIVSDHGKGMDCPKLLLNRGKADGLGSGLAGIQKLVDSMRVSSAPAEGTRVTLDVWATKVEA